MSMARFFLAVSVLPFSLLTAGSLYCTFAQNALAPTAAGAPSDPRPVDAATVMIRAFDTHPIVALGDLHGCQELYDFIHSLLHNLELKNKANDIVVEFGNSLYQDLADSYVAGKEVPPAELTQIWRNHTNPKVFDSPVYEQFFQTVRELNQSLPEGNRWRVLLGDPPIDWSKTATNKEWGRMLYRRDAHFAGVVEKEVLAKGRRALLIIGGAHLLRGIDKENVTGRVEAQRPGSMFIVIPHSGFSERNEEIEARLAKWKSGTLALLKSTWLGDLHPGLRWPQLKNVKLSAAGDSKEPRLEDVADAWLYVGPRESLTEVLPFPGIYRDEYWKELNRRNLIMWGKPLSPSSDDFNTSARYYVKPR
jgi:hypothetical protein